MERVEIDVPVAAGLRAGCGCLAVVVVFSACVAVVTVLAGSSGQGITAGEIVAMIALFGVLPVAITAGLWALVVKRTRTWLEGSYLVRRATLRTTRIELPAVENVYLETLPDVRSDERIPILVIKDAAKGPVRLPLRSKSGWLPPGQLHALADRIQAGGRHDEVVTEMRHLADTLDS